MKIRAPHLLWGTVAAVALGFVVLGGVAFTTSASAAPDIPRDGDIVFQQSLSRQGKALELATESRYTHVGVVFVERGVPYVYEASRPVGKITLKRWIDKGKGDHYVRKRLKKASDLDFKKLRAEVGKFLGRRYDMAFNWSDKKIYCSELVWKAYHRAFNIEVGALKKIRDFNLKHPVVKKDLKRRYKGKVPLDMSVIAPSDMFDSDLLVTVAED